MNSMLSTILVTNWARWDLTIEFVLFFIQFVCNENHGRNKVFQPNTTVFFTNMIAKGNRIPWKGSVTISEVVFSDL